VQDSELPDDQREFWLKINQEVSDWNVNITDEKDPMPDAEKYDGEANKYATYGIIPIKEIT